MSIVEHCNVYTRFVTNSQMQQRPSDTLWQAFGAWVKGEREAKRLTQSDAARAAGIDRQHWYRIESGKSGTKRDTVIAIARALEVSESIALDRAGYSPQIPEERHRLPEGVTIYFDSSSDLTDEQKDKLLDVINMIVAGVRAGGG